MTLSRAIGALLAVTFLLGAAGCGIGYALGRFMPSYYRSVFQAGSAPDFDPVSVGVGQGVTQGTAGGVVAGLILVALLCWRDVRVTRTALSPTAVSTVAERRTSTRLLFIVSGLLILIICTSAALLLGNLSGARRANHQRYLEERQALAPVLAADPLFSDVQIVERRSGGVYLIGGVSSEADLERLRTFVTQTMGVARGEEMLIAVSIRK